MKIETRYIDTILGYSDASENILFMYFDNRNFLKCSQDLKFIDVKTGKTSYFGVIE